MADIFNLEEFKKNGYTVFRSLLSREGVHELQNLTKTSAKINVGMPQIVESGNGMFQSHSLAYSKAAFDLVTNKEILKFCDSYFNSDYRLKCQRAYTMKGSYYFPWHTDNKIDDTKDKSQGIAFIAYLTDTTDGAVEVFPGSHKWSHKIKPNVITKKEIKEYTNYDEKILLAGKAGDIIATDVRTIHGSLRKKGGLKRFSYWFQVTNELDAAEPLLINTSIVPKQVDSRLANYLGFGLPNIDRNYPLGGIPEMSTVYSICKIFEFIFALPHTLINDLKRKVKYLLAKGNIPF